MNKDEALRLALEALLEYQDHLRGQAIAAIKQALAQEKALQALHNENERLGLYKDAYGQPEPEPVAVVAGYYGGQCVIVPTNQSQIFNSNTALYTSPPKREWQGLTKQEAEQLVEDCDWYNDPVSFCFDVEAKLKEKNT